MDSNRKLHEINLEFFNPNKFSSEGLLLGPILGLVRVKVTFRVWVMLRVRVMIRLRGSLRFCFRVYIRMRKYKILLGLTPGASQLLSPWSILGPLMGQLHFSLLRTTQATFSDEIFSIL